MSLLFNMLSRLDITFLPRSKCLLISWLQSPSAVILKPAQNKVCHCFHFSICLPWSDGPNNARRLHRWASPGGQHQNQNDFIICSQSRRSSVQSAKTRPGADCGSDHELLIAKFRLKLKKVEKTARPFRYDIHQIPYDYKVEVRNRFGD